MPERKTQLERFASFSVWAFPGAFGLRTFQVHRETAALTLQQEEGACVGGACKLIGCLLGGGVPWENRKPKGAQQMKRSDERWTS